MRCAHFETLAAMQSNTIHDSALGDDVPLILVWLTVHKPMLPTS